MRIIFLDFDGVLANAKTGFEPGVFDKVAVSILNTMIVATEARVVISSSWRFMYEYDEMVTLLRNHGFTGDIIGVTPKIIDSTISRGAEIGAWIGNYAVCHPYGDTPIDGIVILDDDTNMGRLGALLVKTQTEIGLQPKHIEQVVDLFEQQTAENYIHVR